MSSVHTRHRSHCLRLEKATRWGMPKLLFVFLLLIGDGLVFDVLHQGLAVGQGELYGIRNWVRILGIVGFWFVMGRGSWLSSGLVCEGG